MASAQRYSSLAILLHWGMAIGFLLMLGSGILMVNFELDRTLQFQIYQWHKAGGVLMLFAFSLRLTWRLITKFLNWIPPLPSAFSARDKILAHLGHFGLYGLMTALPLTGWVMASASIYGLPTIVFGWFTWPHVPGIQGEMIIYTLAKQSHEILAWLLILTVVIHIAAVIKHYKIEKINLLRRMWWTKRV